MPKNKIAMTKSSFTQDFNLGGQVLQSSECGIPVWRQRQLVCLPCSEVSEIPNTQSSAIMTIAIDVEVVMSHLTSVLSCLKDVADAMHLVQLASMRVLPAKVEFFLISMHDSLIWYRTTSLAAISLMLFLNRTDASIPELIRKENALVIDEVKEFYKKDRCRKKYTQSTIITMIYRYGGIPYARRMYVGVPGNKAYDLIYRNLRDAFWDHLIEIDRVNTMRCANSELTQKKSAKAKEIDFKINFLKDNNCSLSVIETLEDLKADYAEGIGLEEDSKEQEGTDISEMVREVRDRFYKKDNGPYLGLNPFTNPFTKSRRMFTVQTMQIAMSARMGRRRFEAWKKRVADSIAGDSMLSETSAGVIEARLALGAEVSPRDIQSVAMSASEINVRSYLVSMSGYIDNMTTPLQEIVDILQETNSKE